VREGAEQGEKVGQKGGAGVQERAHARVSKRTVNRLRVGSRRRRKECAVKSVEGRCAVPLRLPRAASRVGGMSQHRWQAPPR